MKRWLPILVATTAVLLPNAVVFSQDKAEDTAKKVEEKELSTSEQITKFISDGQLTKADKLIDGLEQDSKQTDRFRTQLATAFMRKRDYAGATAQYEAQLQAEMAKEKFSAARIASLVGTLRAYMPRANRADEIMAMVEKASELVSSKVDKSKASADMESLLRLNVVKSSLLRSDDQVDEANAILAADFKLTQELHATEGSDISARLYSAAMRNLMPSEADMNVRSEMLAEHQALTSKLAEAGDTEMAVAFVQAALSEVGRSYRTEPAAAEATLITLKEFVDHHAENKKIAARLTPYSRSIASYESRLESSKKLLAMIGKQAPAMDADVNWVGVEQPMDTKGKVVLLDFWALWCGPCINTFPHLKHLTEEYGDQGFQVVGVTRYYNYTWDEEAERAVRGDRSADPNPEVENEVLQKFMASHGLTHPTVVVSGESTMHKDFGVSGIPHVALLDQQGRIQMVKVGSGEANAQAIESKIKELLGLTESSATSAGE
ncbi:MAG: TlpA disulfide reductase family protein [Fuerstiella sp.]